LILNKCKVYFTSDLAMLKADLHKVILDINLVI